MSTSKENDSSRESIRKVVRLRIEDLKRPLMFDSSFEGWTVTFLKRNYWRLSPLMEWEDAMQEMKAIFYKCRNKYGDKVDGSKHLMALYKISVINFVNTQSVRASRHRDTFENIEDDNDTKEQMDLPDFGIHTIFRTMPEELVSMLQVLADSPKEVLAAMKLVLQGESEDFPSILNQFEREKVDQLKEYMYN